MDDKQELKDKLNIATKALNEIATREEDIQIPWSKRLYRKMPVERICEIATEALNKILK